jgi:Eco57I restriction-modification methylase
MADDRDLKPSDILSLSDRDGVVGFFASLGYQVDRPVVQTPQAIGITAETLQRQIRHIERVADHEHGTLQVYLVELRSVTQASLQGLARAFRNRAGQYLLVITSDYEELDFVLLERVLPEARDHGLGTRQVGVRPRTLTVNRRNPGPVELRVLRRFTFTEADAEAQYDKLLSAYNVADWSEKFFNNRALFSDYYLNDRLRSLPEWSEDPKPTYKLLRGLYAGSPAKFTGKEESLLRKELFEPALAALGFEARQGKSGASDEAEPDYRLFAARPQANDKAVAVCLAYVWGRSLDGKDEARDLQTPEENPSFAVVSLLERSEAPLAVVTNGKVWRLYSAKAHSRATNYYEIDLEEALASSDPNEFFRYFWLLFRAVAFAPQPVQREGQTQSLSFLDRLLDESEAFAKRLGDRLKDRVFEEIFPHFAEGFIHASGGTARLLALPDARREAELSDCFQATLTFLYRLLFLLYAESRDLLPVRETRGYWEVSLTRLKEAVAKAAGPLEDGVRKNLERAYGNDSTALYDRIFKLCRIVDQGSQELNVPLYNGGLFLTTVAEDDTSEEAKHARFLATHRLPDRFLALGLDLMARDVDEKRCDLVFIDYKSLGVRQLGSIYEGLLEFKLCVATVKMSVVKGKKTEEVVPYAEAKRKALKILTKGRGKGSEEKTYSKGTVYLENDRRERKATGSYYTPDHIVNYIVENTVGPVLEGKFEALRPRLREAQKALAKEREKALALQKALGKSDDPEHEAYLKTRIVVDEFFSVKVLDPAMGSGHFLVEAVDLITDRMLRFLNAFPWNPIQYELGETRREILDAMEDQGVVIDRARLTDVNLLKRHVLKRCIYGVDLNPMAVELAKVSLWLDCFTLGAPLSFLDHHLKCGNSLIGATIEEAKKAIEGVTQLDLFGSRFAGLMSATELMRRIGELSDVTAKQVEESRREYRKASDALAPFKRMLDVYTSQWFRNEKALDLFRRGHADEWFQEPGATKRLSSEDQAIVQAATKATSEKGSFHWELEFPEVFFGPRPGTTRVIEHLEGSGFDAVVGNPPYDELSEHALGRAIDESRFLEGQPAYAVAGGGRLNWYHFFILRSASVLRQGGLHGFIVPMSLLGDQFTRSLRKHILTCNRLRLVDAFPQKDDPRDRVFFEAKLPTCLYVMERQKPGENFRVRTHPGRFISQDSPTYLGDVDTLSALDSENLAIPLVSEAGWRILKHIIGCEQIGRLRDYGATPTSGEIVFNKAFRPYLTDDPTETLILRGSHVQRWEIVQDAKQGEPVYLRKARYLKDARKDSKAYHFQQARVVYQECAAIDNWRRVIAAHLSAGKFCGHKICYFVDYKCSPMTLLAIFNSTLVDWFVKGISTNNSLPAYLVGGLPFPKFIPINQRRTSQERLEPLIQSYQSTLRNRRLPSSHPGEHSLRGEFGELLESIGDSVDDVGPQSNLAHDILAYLAEQMIELNRLKQAEIRRFLDWLGATLAIRPNSEGNKEADTLDGKTTLHNYLGDYQKNEEAAPFSAIWDVLLKNKQRINERLDGELQRRVRSGFDKSLRVLLPIKGQLAATDWLIDQLVYRLYGLKEDEIAVVEGQA